ncbi:hypothetical protein [Pseudomonas syringae]
MARRCTCPMSCAVPARRLVR